MSFDIPVGCPKVLILFEANRRGRLCTWRNRFDVKCSIICFGFN